MSRHGLKYPRPNPREIFRPYETFSGIGPLSRLPRHQRQFARISLEDDALVRVSQALQRSPACPVSCVFEPVGDREPLGIRTCSSGCYFPGRLIQPVGLDTLSRSLVRPMENG